MCVVGLGFITLYWVLLGFNERVLPDFGMIELFLGFTVFFQFSVLLFGFYCVGFYNALLGFTGFYWVLPTILFTEFPII